MLEKFYMEEEKAMPKLLFLGEIETAHQNWNDLEHIANFQVLTFLPLCGVVANNCTKQLKHTTPEQFLEFCKTDAYADISVIVRTFDSTQVFLSLQKLVLREEAHKSVRKLVVLTRCL